jgi:hypothetical protein
MSSSSNRTGAEAIKRSIVQASNPPPIQCWDGARLWKYPLDPERGIFIEAGCRDRENPGL